MSKRIFIFFLILVLATPAWAIKYKGDLESNESITFPEQSSKPTSPASTKHKLYFMDDGAVYTLDSSGNENPVVRGGYKNQVINGGFRLWQRGTSFTTANAYGADRWKHSPGDGTGTTSRQAFTLGQTDVSGEPEYYFQHDRTVAATTLHTIIRTRIEDVRTLAGQTLTLSFWAKTAAAKSLQVGLSQNFGTGGSPSSPVSVLNQAESFTTSWVRYTYTVAGPSISGKTIGTNGDDYLEFLIQEGASFSTFTLDIANVQIEKGSVATEFERRPLSLELSLAQRYYWKTYNQAVAPGASSPAGMVELRLSGLNTAVHLLRMSVKLPVVMRATPAFTFYTDGGTSGNWRDFAASADVAVSAARSSETAAAVEGTYSSATQIWVGGHVTADAEL